MNTIYIFLLNRDIFNFTSSILKIVILKIIFLLGISLLILIDPMPQKLLPSYPRKTFDNF